MKCHWIRDVLTNRPQVVRIGDNTSSTLVPEHRHTTGLRVLSPALFTLFTSDCSAIHPLHKHHRESLQTTPPYKTKEVIVDYRRSRRTEHAPLLIHGEAVEHVNNIKFLGIHITSDLTWSMMNTAHLVKKAQQRRLFFLRKLKRAGLSPQLLTNFYRASIESILCLRQQQQQCGMAAAALHKTPKRT
ncbi:hypothetical protein L3Q82_017668 [Scortum barcoo]|uniref:Uncharacterized protein n=1 Tax=Scortum barcoo TaxID=214431 RepID=A0ACB8VMG6_9TELE|nr:hypothetical protein L3Q82_017668 [Scortum barcoo]